MEYKLLAEELLQIRSKLFQTPSHRIIDEFSHGEIFVLNYLFKHNGTAYPKDLSREMSVSTARIAALLNQLEKKGWINRTSDHKDNRQTIIVITNEGHQEIIHQRSHVIELVVNMLEELGPEDAIELLKIHRKIIKEEI